MREQKGITLIALVITIIVLLILAGVAIAMLSGENGILNRASEAKYDNVLASVDEQVKLAQLSLKTSITSNMVSKTGYIATGSDAGAYLANSSDPIFGALVKEVADGLTATTTVDHEKFAVKGYIDVQGKTDKDGVGYILITYSDNALRSSLPTSGNTSVIAPLWTVNGIAYNTSELTESLVNQATVAYAIKVENYDCTLCNNAAITSFDNLTSDFGQTSFIGTGSDATTHAGALLSF